MSGVPKSTTPGGHSQDVPLWRKHFPVDTAVETSQTRREFIGGCTVAGGAMVCGQAALNKLCPLPNDDGTIQRHAPMTLEKTFSELRDGEALLFHYPDHKSPCLLVRMADEVVAFSQKCTHLACPVIPDVETEKFLCPCHKGAFGIRTGAPLSGPPRSPLSQVIIAKSEDGTLTATGIQPG